MTSVVGGMLCIVMSHSNWHLHLLLSNTIAFVDLNLSLYLSGTQVKPTFGISEFLRRRIKEVLFQISLHSRTLL